MSAPQDGNIYHTQQLQSTWMTQQNNATLPSSQLILRQNSTEQQTFSTQGQEAESPEIVRATPQVGSQTLTQQWLQTLQNLYYNHMNLHHTQTLQERYNRNSSLQLHRNMQMVQGNQSYTSTAQVLQTMQLLDAIQNQRVYPQMASYTQFLKGLHSNPRYNTQVMQMVHNQAPHMLIAPQNGNTYYNSQLQSTWMTQQNNAALPSSQLILRQNSTEQQTFSTQGQEAESPEIVRATPQVGSQTLTQQWLQTVQNLYHNHMNLHHTQTLQERFNRNSSLQLHRNMQMVQGNQSYTSTAQILQTMQLLDAIQNQRFYPQMTSYTQFLQGLHANSRYNIQAMQMVHNQASHMLIAPQNGDTYYHSQLQSTWMTQQNNAALPSSQLILRQNSTEQQTFSTQGQEAESPEIVRATPQVGSQTLTQQWLQTLQNLYYNHMNLHHTQTLQERYNRNSSLQLHRNMQMVQGNQSYTSTAQVLQTMQLLDAIQNQRLHPQMAYPTRLLQGLHSNPRYNPQAMQMVHNQASHMLIAPQNGDTYYHSQLQSTWMTQQNNAALPSSQLILRQNSTEQQTFSTQGQEAESPEIVRATPQMRSQTLTQQWLQTVQNLHHNHMNLHHTQTLQERYNRNSSLQLHRNMQMVQGNQSYTSTAQVLQTMQLLDAIQNQRFYPQMTSYTQFLQGLHANPRYNIQAMKMVHNQVSQNGDTYYNSQLQSTWMTQQNNAALPSSQLILRQNSTEQQTSSTQEQEAESPEIVRATPQMRSQTLTQQWLQTLQNLYHNHMNLHYTQTLQERYNRNSSLQLHRNMQMVQGNQSYTSTARVLQTMQLLDAIQNQRFYPQMAYPTWLLQGLHANPRYNIQAMQIAHNQASHMLIAPQNGDTYYNSQLQSTWMTQQNNAALPSSQLILRQNSTEQQTSSTQEQEAESPEIVRATPQMRSQTLTQQWLQTVQNLYHNHMNLHNTQTLQERYNRNSSLQLHRNMQMVQGNQSYTSTAQILQTMQLLDAIQNQRFYPQMASYTQFLQGLHSNPRYNTQVMQIMYNQAPHMLITPQNGDTYYNSQLQNTWMTYYQNQSTQEQYIGVAGGFLPQNAHISQTITLKSKNRYLMRHSTSLFPFQKANAIQPFDDRNQMPLIFFTDMQKNFDVINKPHRHIAQIQPSALPILWQKDAAGASKDVAQALRVLQTVQTTQLPSNLTQTIHQKNELQTAMQRGIYPLVTHRRSLDVSYAVTQPASMTSTTHAMPKQNASDILTEMIYRKEDASTSAFLNENQEMPELLYSVPRVPQLQNDAEEHADGEQELLRQVQATAMQKRLAAVSTSQSANVMPSDDAAVVTRSQVQQMMEDFQSTQNQRLVRQVMEKMEQTLRTERRRFGKLR